MTKKPTDIERTQTSLRQLLDSLYDVNESLVFEDLLLRFTACIAVKFDCLVYLKEKVWFQDRFLHDDHLKFSYLSFRYEDKNTVRFADRMSLVQAEKEAADAGYKREDARLITIWHRSTESTRDLDRILNLTKRIFVAFYKNCGANSHFRESVTRRFIREYFKKYGQNSELNSVADYVYDRTSIEVSICNQKDELGFHQNQNVADLLNIRATSGADHSIIFNDKNFARDLKTSVTRKNQTYGKTENGIYYVVQTLLDSYFLGETEHADFKTEQLAIVIYSNTEGPISLDAVTHSNRLVDTFLKAAQERQYHSTILNGVYRCALLEEKLSVAPVSSKEELISRFNELITPLLNEVALHTRADAASMYLYEPFSNSLVRIGDNKKKNPVDAIPLTGGSNYVCAEAWLNDLELDLWHPNKLRQDLDETKERPLKIDADKKLLQQRMNLKDSLDRVESSVIALPIRKGKFPIGIMEFSSGEASRLSYDERFLELISSMCGDIIRRLELANDRGWLTRMSFIHTARHKIEAIFRDIRPASQPLFDELIDIIDKGARVKPIEFGPTKFSNLIANVEKNLEKQEPEYRERIIQSLSEINNVCSIPPRACDLISEIFETLDANKSHSALIAKDILISLQENATSSSYLAIQYAPENIAITTSIMERICIAPIPDDKTHTFHYGLFLLGCQLRMAGGAAATKPISENSFGGSSYGVAFLVPLEE